MDIFKQVLVFILILFFHFSIFQQNKRISGYLFFKAFLNYPRLFYSKILIKKEKENSL
jgi:hypothetical protein